MAWPIGAARPLSGSSIAMRALPEAVIGEPTGASRSWAGSGRVLGWGGSVQAPSRKATVASAKRDWRIGAILRRTAADGRERTITS